MNLLGLIKLLTTDIDECFNYADELIDMDLEPWRTLATASALDNLRRQYIIEAANNGATILSISGSSKLSPKAVRTIIDSQVSTR